MFLNLSIIPIFKTRLKKAKLEKKIARKRTHHIENVVLDIIRKSEFIGIEDLSVKDMYVKRNKEKIINYLILQ